LGGLLGGGGGPILPMGWIIRDFEWLLKQMHTRLESVGWVGGAG